MLGISIAASSAINTLREIESRNELNKLRAEHGYKPVIYERPKTTSNSEVEPDCIKVGLIGFIIGMFIS